jgi:hypothetical protein
MKKIALFIFTVVIGLAFTACEDPYANQKIAAPTAYSQETLQDTTGFTATLKAGLSPLTIQSSKLSEDLSLLTCTSVFTLKDTTATNEYKIEFSNTANFSEFKTIPITYSGVVNTDVKVGCKQFNDSIKVYNKNAAQRTVYIRLLSIIVKNGTRSAYKSATLSLLVTPNNYVPVPMNDIASLPMGSSVTIDVLGNDTDPEKDVLTIASVTTPTHGTASIVSGKVLYTPTSGYSGADSFGYTVSDGNGNTATANVDVNVMAIMPYTSTTPRPWYIIGLANGGWNNSAAGLGVSIYPLSVISGNKYNTAGDGEYTFTGYFSASRSFKLIRDLGNWDIQWGMSGTVYKHNDGGAGNISVPADGYYTISLNSITDNLTIVAASVTPTTYTKVGLIGGFNSWGTDLLMTPCESTNNHMWYITTTFATDTELKFRADADWGKNWGAAQFPVGIGTNGGSNIAVKAGTYTVIFNDIDGTYYFK